MKQHQYNLTMVKHVARHLGQLREQFVFLGGAVTALLLTDAAAPSVRPTKDVDMIVEVSSRIKYYQLEEELRHLGFRHVQDMICRWSIGEVLVDIMPTDSTILGFSNCWYSAAIKNAQNVEIEDGLFIRLITPEYFLATKIEAFEGRGQKDYWLSNDLEDIVTLLDGRPEIVNEVLAAELEIKQFLKTKMQAFLNDQCLLEAFQGHLPSDEAEQRYPLILKRIQDIVNGVN